jgi:hypothetical protein
VSKLLEHLPWIIVRCIDFEAESVELFIWLKNQFSPYLLHFCYVLLLYGTTVLKYASIKRLVMNMTEFKYEVWL